MVKDGTKKLKKIKACQFLLYATIKVKTTRAKSVAFETNPKLPSISITRLMTGQKVTESPSSF